LTRPEKAKGKRQKAKGKRKKRQTMKGTARMKKRTKEAVDNALAAILAVDLVSDKNEREAASVAVMQCAMRVLFSRGPVNMDGWHLLVTRPPRSRVIIGKRDEFRILRRETAGGIRHWRDERDNRMDDAFAADLIRQARFVAYLGQEGKASR
jgi:hypothetical protein